MAETEAAAQAAARAVEVEYQDIAPVLSIDQAMEAGAFFEVQHSGTCQLSNCHKAADQTLRDLSSHLVVCRRLSKA